MTINRKWIVWMQIAVLLVIFVLLLVLNSNIAHMPRHVRLLIFQAYTGLGMAFMGFIFGRQYDQKGKSKTQIQIGMALLLALSIWFVSSDGIKYAGMAIGLLVGFIIGIYIATRVKETYGDSPEGDKILNIRPSSKHRMASEYLENQSAPVRAFIKRYHFTVIMLAFLCFAVMCWTIYVDLFGSLARYLFVHEGDGTVHFLTMGPIITGGMFFFLLMPLLFVYEEKLQSSAVEYKDNLIEYLKLASGMSIKRDKVNRIIMQSLAVMMPILLILAINTYTRITDKGMYINGFWSLSEKYYTWDDIKQVDAGYKTKRSSRKPEYSVVITFKDGYTWKPDTSIKMQADVIKDAVGYIEQYRKS